MGCLQHLFACFWLTYASFLDKFVWKKYIFEATLPVSGWNLGAFQLFIHDLGHIFAHSYLG